MRYRVPPGLYAVGSPAPESPVLVSANYKMSFDHLRSSIPGLGAWILVLDTRGINVWCAAGKGTFGTDEIVRRVGAARLSEIVTHGTLIVPQLGAPGVSAHEVKRRAGFRVVYGPVRARDLPLFLQSGMRATPGMRRVRFPFLRRVELAPSEVVLSAKYTLPIAAGFFLLSGLGPDGYSAARLSTIGTRSALIFSAGYLAAVFGTPMLLPWLPGRSFSLKGAWIGLAAVAGAAWAWTLYGFDRPLGMASWVLLLPAIASFVAMNFTGASTYTSLSGVRREMRVAVPIQAAAAAVGLGLWIAGRFV